MHNKFFPLFIVSLIGVLATSGLQHSQGIFQWAGLAAGLLPLAIYHFILLKKQILSPTEVDSVYYFGFLVTVVTLVSTAISIGLTKEHVEMQWVLLQFGLGLVATGYALFARLHLLSKTAAQAEVDVVASTERLVKSVERVVGEFDRAGYQVTAFVDQTEQRMLAMQQASKAQLVAAEAKFEEKLNAALLAFNDVIAKALGNSLNRCSFAIDDATNKFSVAISTVFAEIGRIQTEAQAISFAKAAERIEQFSSQMELSIKSITTNVADASHESAMAINELVSTSRKTQRLATQISSKLDSLNGLTTLLESISSVTDALSGVSKTVVLADGALSSLAVRSEQADNQIRESVISPLSSANFATSIERVNADLKTASTMLSESLSVLGMQTSNIASMLENSRHGLEASLLSAAAGLGSVEKRLAPLDELAAHALMAIDELRSATAAMKATTKTLSAPATTQGIANPGSMQAPPPSP